MILLDCNIQMYVDDINVFITHISLKYDFFLVCLIISYTDSMIRQMFHPLPTAYKYIRQ